MIQTTLSSSKHAPEDTKPGGLKPENLKKNRHSSGYTLKSEKEKYLEELF